MEKLHDCVQIEEFKDLKFRVTELEKQNIAFSKDISNLIEKLESLVKTLDNYSKMLISTVITTLITGALGLLFFLAQRGLN